MIHLVLKGTSDDVRVSIASGSIGSAVLYEGLVVRMVVGRHGGLVGTKEALGEENEPCLLYGYMLL